MTGPRVGTCYLQVVAAKYPYELKVVGVTQRKPTITHEGSVVVKIKLAIPQGAFVPLEPSAIVVVPESLVQHPIEVEAVEP